ncbi:MAG TPA: alpha-2-macroglobulin family protein, partial [Kofleriaceae bacterium]|nr:alpha-2-macroglobulin family protein [Kofleriaceae bacterium]
SVSAGPHFVGGVALASAKATYYAGGALPGSDVHWDVFSSPGSFTPPNRDDWTFGTFVPYWGWREDGGWVQPTQASFEGKTDPTGQHVLKIDLVSLKPPRPMQVTANATVVDVNRQPIASTTMFLVHPSSLYVGLRTKAPFVDAGKPIEVEAIVVDLDGKAVPGVNVDLRAVRMDWTVEKGQWKEVEADPQSCQLTSAADAGRCSFKTGDEGGRFQITARVVDKQDRLNETELPIWVAGGQMPPERNLTQEQVMLIPDQKEYRAGQAAHVMVQAPFFPAEGVLSLRRSGIVSTRHFHMNGPSTTLDIPVVDAYTPNLWVQVDLIGSAPRVGDDGKPDARLPRRPAFARGEVNLAVPPNQRTLAVAVAPRDRRVEPGGVTSLAITVTDAGKRPVAGAELAVVVVDEAVLALSAYRLADPMATFYPQRDPGNYGEFHQRGYVALARPELDALGGDRDGDGIADMKAADDAEGGAAPPADAAPPPPPKAPEPTTAGRAMNKNGAPGGGGGGATPIAVRTNFDPLAVFSPSVTTGADGRATVDIKLPDNLTRYRVMVVAVAGERQFGKGESAITARLPLMVRPSAPRFLNFGDRFELPVVLQNQTDAPMPVRVAVRGANLALPGDRGFALSIPANDRVEIRFAAAAEMPGTARLQIAAASDRWADAAEVALPVWTPATTEAFATYGTIENGAIKQPVAMPADVQPSFGSLEITTSSTQLQALTDAFVYLVAYPYECSEQVSSRVLAVAALRDVLTAFKAEGLPPAKEIEKAVDRDLEKLKGMQNPADGGWGFWRMGEESWPFTTIHVAHALARAQEKKYPVDADMQKRAMDYLRDIRRHTPAWYPEEIKRALEAYALYVRKVAGDADTARARNLLVEGGGIGDRSLETVGWLYYVMAGDAGSSKELAQIRRHLENHVSEESGTAHFVTSYGDGAYLLLHSDRRVDGIVLEALLADQPKHDLVPKVVRGLLGHRTAGRWENTQENAFVLLALDRYFHEYEKVTPNFVARAWLGDSLAGEHTFKGRTTDYQQIDVPMAWLDKHKAADLTLAKEGAGRLYYRIGMTYAPKSLKLEPSEHGFTVQRTYEAIDKPSDVVHQSDGTWKIRAGARVRVTLSMVNQGRRYHVALVDPLPAGLEAMNPALATTGVIPQNPAAQKRDPWWWWTGVWYEHQNLRDERVEAFTSLLWEGVHEYTYVARATTPGTFVVPPTKAEEMYHPETFGRSASDRVVIE